MFKKIAVSLLAIVGLFALAACSDSTSGPTTSPNSTTPVAETPKDLKEVKIGVIAPMSGDAASYGTQIKGVLDYNLEDVNKDMAKVGYKFTLVYEDGKCDGASAVTAFQKLTDVDGVKFIMGGLCSSETLAMAPLLADKGVLEITPWSSNPEIEGKSPNLFSLSYSDDLVGNGIADELGKYKKVALLTEQSDFTQGLKKVVEKTLKEKYPSVEIVANEEFPKGTTDFRNVLDKLKASGAEVVLLNPNIGVTAETFVKQLAEIKDWKVPFVSHIAYLADKVLAIAPTTVEGMVVIDAPTLTEPAFTEYKDKIVAAHGSLDGLGTFYTATSMDALNILTHLIADNNEEVSKVRDSLATQTFQGWLGNKMTFSGKSFIQGVSVARYVVKDGKAVLSQ